ncbi:MAG: fumarylacetoacetate hydrolase family protein [Candidatus Bathyarchaeia archaeon]
MKLATFEVKTAIGPVERIGAVIQADFKQEYDKLVDLTSSYAAYLAETGAEIKIYEQAYVRIPPNMTKFLEGGDLSMKAAQETINFLKEKIRDGDEQPKGPKGEKLIFDLSDSDVKLLAPMRPIMLYSFSCYEDHGSSRGIEKDRNWYRRPAFYHKLDCSSIINPGEPIVRPYYTQQLDLEIELAYVIGKVGRNITVEEGQKYIAGYTIFVDGSARDVSGERGEPGLLKHKDFCNCLGPYIVTPDEFNERDAKVWTRVNGEVWFEGNTGDNRVFFGPEIIAYLADTKTIMPGEVVSAGTIGLGCSLDIDKWFEPGMIVEFEIENIGILKHPIIQGEKVVDYVLNGMEKYAHLKYEDRPGKGKVRRPPLKG